MRVFVVASVLACAIAGCTNPNNQPINVKLGTSTDTVVMGPNLRLVTERARPIDDGTLLPTVCTEPSPDVAVAFGRSLAVHASVAETGATTTSGSINAASTETATALAGRTAGVLALRDGLYAACQSYVNGMLGHDAYAVILSQYGRLLVALAGTGTGGNPVNYTAQEAAISAMLIACISEHDPTRVRPIRNGRYDLNPLFSEPRCRRLMDSVAHSRMPPKVAEKPKAADKSEKPKPGGKVTKTEKTITQTVTESSAPPK